MTPEAPPPPNTKRPRRVLVVTPYFATHGGDIETTVASFIRLISRSGSFSFLWAATSCGPLPDCPPGQKTLPMKSFNLLENLFGIQWPLWSPQSFKRLCWAINKAEIVWLHNTLSPGCLFAFLYAKKQRKPIVITQHASPAPYRNPLRRGAAWLIDRLITCPMLKAANETVFCSDQTAEDYFRRISFSHSIKVIPYGITPSPYHEPSAKARALIRDQFSLKANQPVLLYVGPFKEKKGVLVIRSLAKLLPGWRFWLVNPVPRGREIIPEKWQLPNVHVFRERTEAALADLYHAADLFVLPSYGEGFPAVIQEALSCGIPVLCSPATAAGSQTASFCLYQAEVWPGEPHRTANLWLHRLQRFPLPLPLKDPRFELSTFARNTWPCPPIATAYSEVFRSVFNASS